MSIRKFTQRLLGLDNPVIDTTALGRPSPSRYVQSFAEPIDQPSSAPAPQGTRPRTPLGRFIALLPLLAAPRLTEAGMIQRLSEDFPTAKVEPLPGNPASRGRPGDPILFRIDGVFVTLLPVDVPFPAETVAIALERPSLWNDASQVIAGHSAHLAVATLGKVETHEDARRVAAAVMLASAAAVAELGGAGIYWSSGDLLVEGEAWRMGAMALAMGETPTMMWISLPISRLAGQPPGTLIGSTLGLHPFVERELEFTTDGYDAVELASKLSTISEYLIKRGPIIGDNQTVGISNEERIRVRHAPTGDAVRSPVLKLTLEAAAR